MSTQEAGAMMLNESRSGELEMKCFLPPPPKSRTICSVLVRTAVLAACMPVVEAWAQGHVGPETEKISEIILLEKVYISLPRPPQRNIIPDVILERVEVTGRRKVDIGAGVSQLPALVGRQELTRIPGFSLGGGSGSDTGKQTDGQTGKNSNFSCSDGAGNPVMIASGNKVEFDIDRQTQN
jgi:hypothetical protein